MREHRSALAVFEAFLMIVLATPSKAEDPKQYLVEVKLTATSPDGHEKVLSNPRLVMIEGHEGEIRLGDNFGPLEGVTTDRMLVSGTSCKLKVVRKDKRLFLDATATHSSGKSNDDEANAVMTGVRVVRAITIGEKITVPAIFEGGRWDLLVREWQPENVKEADLNGPTLSEWKAHAPVQAAAATAAALQ